MNISGKTPFEPKARSSANGSPDGEFSLSSGYLWLSWGSIFGQIFSQIFSRLKLLLLFSAGAFVLHTFLIAVGNDGFNKDSNVSTMVSNLGRMYPWIFSGSLQTLINWTTGDFKVGSQIAIYGNEANAVAGWTIGGSLVWLLIMKVRSNGFLGSLKNLLRIPQSMLPYFRQSANANLVALVAGIFLARGVSGAVPALSQNLLSYYSLALIGSPIPFLFSGVLAGAGGFLARLVPGIPLKNISYGGFAQVAFFGLSAGFFSQSTWQYGPMLGWGLTFYAIYAIFTGGNKPVPVSPRVSFFLGVGLASLAYLLGHDHSAFAHDKGWWENVNQNDPLTTQIVSWVRAGGSDEVMKAGIPPSIGAGIGAAVTDAATKITTYILQVNTTQIAAAVGSSQELLVAVWKCENGGAPFPATDASIQIVAGSRASWLSLFPTSGGCRLTCRVSQTADAVPGEAKFEPVYLQVVGSGGGKMYTATVRVDPTGAPPYILEVF